MRVLSWIGIFFVCFVSGGATCARRAAPMPYPPPPVVWNETPSLADVTAVVNRTANVRQLSTNSATVEVLSMPKVPRLSATINLERERRFRMRANLPIVLGAGMDLGSNDEVFWFEVPEGISKTLYYARHDQFRQQLDRAILPVDPSWVMDAMGLVQIDPANVTSGPTKLADGKLEIRTSMPMPTGIYQRVCWIEPTAGYVTNQFMYAPSGALLAESNASNHRYYADQDCALPHRVELQLTPAVGPPLAMRIEVGDYSVNQLLSGDPNLFAMPQTASQTVDLTTLGGGGPPIVSAPSAYSADAATAYPLRGTNPAPSGRY